MTLRQTTINDQTGMRHEHKYKNGNPIHRWALHRFHRKIRGWIDAIRPRRILDFGCGEGFFWVEMRKLGPLPEVLGLDLRDEAIAVARANNPGMTFLNEDVFDFKVDPGEFDLIIASEVLEHLYQPAEYLHRLCALSPRHLLLTVPHEPYFRLVNLLRGRDIQRWGNHPEHVQQWSRRSFGQFLQATVSVQRLDSSFPFLMALCTPGNSAIQPSTGCGTVGESRDAVTASRESSPAPVQI